MNIGDAVGNAIWLTGTDVRLLVGKAKPKKKPKAK
mgnify:CR=1 FL=1|tara:strand:- start:210 stop:314 length:105 start_codon:yes stop_codon:yes gene_type:complete